MTDWEKCLKNKLQDSRHHSVLPEHVINPVQSLPSPLCSLRGDPVSLQSSALITCALLFKVCFPCYLCKTLIHSIFLPAFNRTVHVPWLTLLWLVVWLVRFSVKTPAEILYIIYMHVCMCLPALFLSSCSVSVTSTLTEDSISWLALFDWYLYHCDYHFYSVHKFIGVICFN